MQFRATGILLTLIMTIAMVIAGVASGIRHSQTEQRRIVYAEDADLLTVDVLKIGKADAIILQCGEETMVIDTGEEDDGRELVDFLQNAGRTHVDKLLITHFDKDHVGGADILAESMEIRQVLVPAYEGTTQEYFDFLDVLTACGITPVRVSDPFSFSLGTANVLVDPPAEYKNNGSEEVDNNFSLITSVSHGRMRFLFTGDAMKARTREWLSAHPEEHFDFLKVPHHGVYNVSQEELADSVTPQYAVICDSQKNPADMATIKALRKAGATVFQTKDGNIHALSNGETVSIGQDR